MTTRKRVGLGIIVILLLISFVCCISVCQSILFPPVTPPEFDLIHEGMPFKDVRAIFGREPDQKFDDGGKKDTMPWVAWHVAEGSILVQRDEKGLVVQRHFQASRSSVVQELQSIWRLARGIR